MGRGSTLLKKLPAREREVAAAVYENVNVSAVEVMQLLPTTLSNSSVRTILKRLEAKGVITRKKEGRRFIYLPSGSELELRRQVLARVAIDYYGGCARSMLKEARELVEDGLETIG